MIYLDTSALVKLIHAETESASLLSWLSAHPDVPLFSSALAEVELARAIRRAAPESLLAVPELLAGLDLVEIDAPIRARAAALAPSSLRSLDAIHLATALEIGHDLVAFVTYDDRLGQAAQAAGLTLAIPTA